MGLWMQIFLQQKITLLLKYTLKIPVFANYTINILQVCHQTLKFVGKLFWVDFSHV